MANNPSVQVVVRGVDPRTGAERIAVCTGAGAWQEAERFARDAQRVGYDVQYGEAK